MSESLEVLNQIVARQSDVIGALQADMAEMKERHAQRELERVTEDNRRLIAGIKAMGWLVLVLGGILWAYRAVIMGDPPKPPQN